MPTTFRVDSAGERLRLINVHAHPDDESSKGAATTAKYVAQGVDVVNVSCTGGERGSVLNARLDTPETAANIKAIRTAEMEAARKILGVEQVWLGFIDSGLPEGDPLPPLPEGCFALEDVGDAAGRLVKVIRAFRPHVLTTYAENGGYPHPDHIQCHNVSMAAVAAAADPQLWPEHGEPWQVQKVYYHMGHHRKRYSRLDELMHEHGLESPYAERLRDWVEDEAASRLTTFVPCGEYFSVRDDALRAHATQVDPDGSWFAVPLKIQQLGWPTEDYELVSSEVPTSIPEDDLFAGVAVEPVAANADGAWQI